MADRMSASPGLTSEAMELFALLAASEGIDDRSEPAIPRRFAEGEFAPLSYGQRRLWFLDRLQPGNPVYNLSFAVRASGALNVRSLSRTLGEVVRRQAVLRTRFELIDGRPVQWVGPAVPLPLPLVDLRGLPGRFREQQLIAIARAEAVLGFDLERGPVVRARLLRLNEGEHAILWMLHHIVSDGWSTGLITGELAALYEAFASGLPSPLPEPALQYADFAAWQAEQLEGGRLESLLAHWRERLADIPQVLELPTDRPRKPQQSFRGGRVSREIGQALTAGLHELARGNRATVFMALTAALQAFLARVSGQGDVVVGTPIADRPRVELESLVGLFINTLVLRSRISREDSFLDLLGRVRDMALDAYAHQDLPFERLVEELQPERSLSHAPIFQVLCVLQSTPAEAIRHPGLILAPIDLGTSTSKLDLSLYAIEEPEGLTLSFEYASDLFDAPTAARLLACLHNLLRTAVSDPLGSISGLPLLTEPERHQLLVEWGDTARDGWLSRPLTALFEETALRTPDAVAVDFEGGFLTYRRLALGSRRLAARLRSEGVARGSFVGVCMERSAELVVALLGVLQAGAAYVPLDPDHPAARLAFMVEESAVPVLLADERWRNAIPAHGAQILTPGAGWDDAEEGEAKGLYGLSEMDDAAYLLYTSGSTGRPKGVMVPHRGIVNRLRWMQEAYGLTPADHVLQKTPFSFDVSVWEFFWPLLVGARLVVARPGGHQDPAYLGRLIERDRVTVLHFVPSMLRAFLEAGGSERLDSLRRVVVSGEALPPDLVFHFYDRVESAELCNLYGPTEASVDVTAWTCGRSVTRSTVPIGREIANTRIEILDLWHGARPAPVGVSGELGIGGVQLARGYLNRPDLTAERFIPDPYSSWPGGRLYRSGDLARRLADGTIEFLGRLDHQVKVRGFRIELGEIEAALLEHPAVGEVVVTARTMAGAQRLAAYLVAERRAGGELPPIEELRAFLADRLPEYMVPSFFVLLPEMPRSPNGKIDRRALPEPETDRPDLAQPFVEARTPLEEVLAGIWSQVLGIERVGARDNFFALGGDSIRSLQMLGALRRRGLALDLATLFRHQTVAELAREIERAETREEAPAESRPFDLLTPEDRARIPAGIEDAYPLTRMQGGMIFHMELSPEQPLFHNVNSWRLRGRFEAGPFREAVRRVVARHPVLRTSFDLTGYSMPLQLVHQGAELPVEIHDCRHLATEEQDRLLDEHSGAEELKRFDVTVPPLLRFQVHRLSDDSFQFTLAENHAIGDGWSLHSTLAEIFEVYLLLLHDQRADSPPLGTSFRDFVALERQALESPAVQRFWHEKLEGAHPLSLSRREAPPAPGTGGVRNVEVDFSPATADEVRRLARAVAVPVKSMLLAVHLAALAAITGEDEVLTGLLLNGRPERPDGEKIRGLFLNVVPLRLRVDGAPFAELAQRAFEAEREVLPFRRFPMAELQRLWGRERLLETEFNFTNFHVVEGLLKLDAVEVLGGGGRLEQTDMALAATFRLTPITSLLSLNLRYDTRLLARPEVVRFAETYRRILEAAIEDPNGPPVEPDPVERHQLLHEWNDTSRPRMPEASIHGMFEAQAAKTPDAVAVVFGTERMTYRELDRRASALASVLRRHGAGLETVVGLHLRRSLRMPVAMLAVLKTGAAWAALSPNAPRSRLEAIERQTSPVLWLTESALASRVSGRGVEALCLDREEYFVGEAKPGAKVVPATLAYVVYTSGSTGEPKGILATHGGVTDYLEFLVETFRLAGDDVALQIAPLTFDASVRDTLAPLVVGGTTVLVDEEDARDPEALLAAAREGGVNTFLSIVPTLLRGLAEQARRDAGGPLGRIPIRRILVSGEPLSGSDVRAAREAFGDELALVNLYGPSECTMTSSYYPTSPEDDRPGPIPIGRPGANARAYVLDSRMRPVAIGALGEVYIGGPGLARGDAGSPDRTAAVFVPDPFSAVPGERLYRTGDQARLRGSGLFEFMGRIDRQVKIRGVRVELGEVEAALRRNPMLSEATVLLREDPPGEPRLVAYWVRRGDERPTVAGLREDLSNRLPAALVPTAFVELPSLPRTSTGKLDRRALPAPLEGRPDLEDSYVPPRTAIEETLAEIWTLLLRVPRIGVRDSFFDLGGHSLLATQIVARARAAFAVELPLRSLFDQPTIEGMAREVTRRGGSERSVARMEVPRAEAGGTLADIADDLFDEDVSALFGDLAV